MTGPYCPMIPLDSDSWSTLIAGSTIFWTLEVEEALNENGTAGLATYFEKSHEQLMDLTRTVAGKITKLQRKSLGALITIDVHARDVVASMRDAGVSVMVHGHTHRPDRHQCDTGERIVLGDWTAQTGWLLRERESELSLERFSIG